jgi:hypothetical protein
MRQGREVRRQVRIRLGPRDRDLLRALGRLRAARTSDLRHLCFDGVRADTGSARLRKLLDGGVLHVSSPSVSAENIYTLSLLGRRLVELEGGAVWSRPRPPLEHHFGIVRTWVQLATLPTPWRLVRGLPDWELRRETALLRLPLVPDLFALLQYRDATLALAIEVDLATESARTLRAKLRAYRRLLSDDGLYGWRDFGLGFALHQAGRSDRIHALLNEEWPGWSGVWLLNDGPSAALHPPLASSPCSHGGAEGVSG